VKYTLHRDPAARPPTQQPLRSGMCARGSPTMAARGAGCTAGAAKLGTRGWAPAHCSACRPLACGAPRVEEQRITWTLPGELGISTSGRHLLAGVGRRLGDIGGAALHEPVFQDMHLRKGLTNILHNKQDTSSIGLRKLLHPRLDQDQKEAHK